MCTASGPSWSPIQSHRISRFARFMARAICCRLSPEVFHAISFGPSEAYVMVFCHHLDCTLHFRPRFFGSSALHTAEPEAPKLGAARAAAATVSGAEQG